MKRVSFRCHLGISLVELCNTFPEEANEMEVQKNVCPTIAGYEIYQLVTHRFRLDGGAMFGSVPKVLWEKRIPSDNLNRIQLCTRVLVLRPLSGGPCVLVDVGMGEKWSEKQRGIYEIETLCNLQQEKTKLFPDGVSAVILTHLHFDHAGGLSYLDAQGQVQLTFPEARYFLQQENWSRAQAPGPREKATYFPENVDPLRKASLTLTTDSQEVLPGISVFAYFGHTAAMQGVLIRGGDPDSESLWYPSDLIPTAHHISLPYVMGYDLCAETTLKEKAAFLERAVQNSWWVVFEHDAETSMVRIQRDEKQGYYAASRADLASWASRSLPA